MESSVRVVQLALSVSIYPALLFMNYSPSTHRQRRMAEIAAAQAKAKFGSVKEISAVDYVDEVNKAGEGVWVVLHLYKTGYLSEQSPTYSQTFLVTVCLLMHLKCSILYQYQ